jgi:hypothetical protein
MAVAGVVAEAGVNRKCCSTMSICALKKAESLVWEELAPPVLGPIIPVGVAPLVWAAEVLALVAAEVAVVVAPLCEAVVVPEVNADVPPGVPGRLIDGTLV